MEKLLYLEQMEKDFPLHVDILECIRQGSCDVIYDSKSAYLQREHSFGLYQLAGTDEEEMISLMDMLEEGPDGIDIVVRNKAVHDYLVNEMGFESAKPNIQRVYLGTVPFPLDLDSQDFTIRKPNEEDFGKFLQTYSEGDDKMKDLLFHSEHFFAAYGRNEEGQSEMAGYIGVHLEGACGVLYVFDKFRRRGLAETLLKYITNYQLARGAYPYGQIYEDNFPSINLSKKIGMTFADGRIYWLWKAKGTQQN